MPTQPGKAQIDRVRDLMVDHAWRTAGDILEEIGIPGDEAAAITARLRDLRKAEHGSYTVAHRVVIRTDGRRVDEYRVGAKGTGEPRRRRRPDPYLRPGVRQFAVDLEAHLQARFPRSRVGDYVHAEEREHREGDCGLLATIIREFAETWGRP